MEMHVPFLTFGTKSNDYKGHHFDFEFVGKLPSCLIPFSATLCRQPKALPRFQTVSLFLYKLRRKNREVASMAKRASTSSSSGQPSQSKRPCVAATDQAWNGSKRNLVPGSCSTEEVDVQRVCGEELERAKSISAEFCQSCTGNAVRYIMQRMHSMENSFQNLVREELERFKSDWAASFQSCFWNALKDILPQMCSENGFQRLKEAVEPANSHSPHLGRGNAKSTANNGARNLQLQLPTKLSLPIFTGNNVEGEQGARIHVTLIDASTGDVVTSGPESSIKLDVVVLEGDFNKDDQDNWAPEEFENYVVKERARKGSLLTGDLIVKLKEGVGQLGELTFTDNSSWNRSKRFKIGIKVASGFCGNTRIREAVTDAFSVREHRGEAYRKHHPPASDDEVWRLENIAKDGKYHHKLSEAGIYKVEDFLLQLFTDPKKLREILGKSITAKKWDVLVDHAKTCKTKWKVYLDYPDGVMKHGAVFNTDDRPIGIVKDGEYFATHRLSAQEKEHQDAIVMKALANQSDVREFNGETFSDSMQNNSSSSFSFGGQTENLNHVLHYLAPPISAAPVGLEASLANGSSTAEVQSPNTNSGTSMEISVLENFRLAAHHPLSADHLNALIPPRYHGSTTAGLPTQSHGINFQNAMHHQMIDSSSQMDHMGYDVLPQGDPMIEDFQSIDLDEVDKWFTNNTPCNDPFSRTLPLPDGSNVREDFQSIHSDIVEERLADNPSYNDTFFKLPFFDNGYAVKGTGRGVIGWLKIKAVLQWGYFIRKRGVRLVELDQPPIEVQAYS
ncbi:hypothetical protein BT93_L0670 [Corymbia citriodora subsp. variegata]|uniref:Calmodulin-binding protein n=1 Tax=Corymbia citriodora subsp. variegata TaxID=360336 RepID=A0A8T0CRZ0_CORYI|nr:hypothetical protein BT93_L0670 [Corymbia citriodora subsp. variegata]